jgi:hypothetical protein
LVRSRLPGHPAGDHYDPVMSSDDIEAVAEELLARPFLDTREDASDWLEGAAQTGSRGHFKPIAVFESLHETPADFDGTAWQLQEEAYEGFERRRRDAVATLTARWGPSQPYSYRPQHDRVLANDESVSGFEYDLAMFTGGEPIPAWRHGDRTVALMLGQMDKEFPIVLTIAVIKTSSAAGEAT